MGDADSGTHPSLLGRLRDTPTDQSAWAEFVERYGRKIYAWCRCWGLQDADAEDLTQAVLLDLVRQMRTFEYRASGSFRAWLHTLAYRAWCDLLQSRKHLLAGSGDSAVFALLNNVEARDELLRHIGEVCDRELLEIASARVRLRVAQATWDAFRLMALEELSGAETAERLGLQVATVFKHKSRVQQLLQEELAKLEVC